MSIQEVFGADIDPNDLNNLYTLSKFVDNYPTQEKMIENNREKLISLWSIIIQDKKGHHIIPFNEVPFFHHEMFPNCSVISGLNCVVCHERCIKCCWTCSQLNVGHLTPVCDDCAEMHPFLLHPTSDVLKHGMHHALRFKYIPESKRTPLANMSTCPFYCKGDANKNDRKRDTTCKCDRVGERNHHAGIGECRLLNCVVCKAIDLKKRKEAVVIEEEEEEEDIQEAANFFNSSKKRKAVPIWLRLQRNQKMGKNPPPKAPKTTSQSTSSSVVKTSARKNAGANGKKK